MASRNPQVKIVFAGDATGLTKALGDVGVSSGGLDSKLGGLVGSMGKVAGALGGMYAIKEVGQFLSEAATSAMEDAQAKDVLHTAIRNITGATEDELSALDQYIEKTQAATGYTEEDLRSAMTKLTTATKDTSKAQGLLGIAMDTATARGTSLDTVVMALEKAQNGNLASLQRLGIATKDAAGNTLSYDQILKNLASTYGGATAAAADTMAGKMERTKLIFGEIKESLGSALMPVIQQFANLIIENMPAIEKIFAAIGQVIGALAPLIGAVLPLFSTLIGWFADLVSWVADKLTGAIEFIIALPGKIGEGLAGAWEAIAGWFGGLGENISGFFTDCGTWLVEHGKAIITGAWDGLKEVWALLSEWGGKIGGWVRDFFLGCGEWLLQLGRDTITGAWGGMKEIWASLSEWGGKIAGWVKDFFLDAGNWLYEHGKSVIDGAWRGLKEIWANVSGWFTGLPGKVKGFFSDAWNWLTSAGKAIINGLWNGLRSIWESLKSWFLDKLSWLNKILPEKYEIHSPSKVFARYGAGIMQGLALGLRSGFGDVEGAMNDIPLGMNGSLAVRGVSATGGAASINNSRTMHNTFYVTGDSGRVIGNQIAAILGGV